MKPRDSSDAEIQALEALCERLAGFDDRVSLEWLDGCMAALLAGPRLLTPSQWLPRLLGDAWERTFADPQDVQQALDTLLGRWNVLASQLDAEALFDEPDQLRLSPLLGDYSDEARDALLAEGKLSPRTAGLAADRRAVGAGRAGDDRDLRRRLGRASRRTTTTPPGTTAACAPSRR